jgi:hypothetical protein
LAALTATAGCLGSGLSCDDHAVVLDRSLTVTDVRFPFDQYGEAIHIVPEFEERGYKTSLTTEVEIPGEPEIAVLSIVGDIERSLVERIFEQSKIRVQSIEVSDIPVGPFFDISHELTTPFTPPLLKQRVETVVKLAEKAGVDLPPLSASQTAVGVGNLEETVTKAQLERTKSILEPSGRFAAQFRKPGWSHEKAAGYKFYSRSGDADNIRSVSLESDGSTYRIRAVPKENLYIKSMFDPGRADYIPEDTENGYIEFTLDGKVITQKELTKLEKKYVEFYKNNSFEDPENFDPVPIIIDDLTAREAVVVGSSLAVPTGSSNLFSVRCRSDG